MKIGFNDDYLKFYNKFILDGREEQFFIILESILKQKWW